MASRTGVGAISITDIRDGIHPISMVLSNQSHTFAADTAGTVVSSERTAFTCEVFAYIGDTRASYSSVASPANNTYNVTIVETAGWVAAKTTVNNQLVISLSTIPSGVVNKTGKLNLTIDIKNYLGNVTTIEAVISLSKAIEGVNGAVVSLIPSRQTFQFDENGNTTDGNVEIGVISSGNVGSLSAFYSANGSLTWSALSVGTTQGKATSIDIDGVGTDKIVISPNNFGSLDVMSFKVSGANGGSDVTSLIHIQDGNTGAAALLVTIKSNTGGFVFKNNAGATKTLTASVYDMADGSEISTGVTYQWRKNDVVLSGKTAKTITVTPSDITDDSSEEYSCHVTVA